MTLAEALAEFDITHEAQGEHDFMRAQGGRFLYWRGQCLGNYDAVCGWRLVELLRDAASVSPSTLRALEVAEAALERTYVSYGLPLAGDAAEEARAAISKAKRRGRRVGTALGTEC